MCLCNSNFFNVYKSLTIIIIESLFIFVGSGTNSVFYSEAEKRNIQLDDEIRCTYFNFYSFIFLWSSDPCMFVKMEKWTIPESNLVNGLKKPCLVC